VSFVQARQRPLPEAIGVVLPRAIGAMPTAGLALAASFRLLAVVPLAPFRQLAFVMAVGIMLEVLVVRALLMPALLTLVGRASAWPSKRLRQAEATQLTYQAGRASPAVRGRFAAGL